MWKVLRRNGEIYVEKVHKANLMHNNDRQSHIKFMHKNMHKKYEEYISYPAVTSQTLALYAGPNEQSIYSRCP